MPSIKNRIFIFILFSAFAYFIYFSAHLIPSDGAIYSDGSRLTMMSVIVERAVFIDVVGFPVDSGASDRLCDGSSFVELMAQVRNEKTITENIGTNFSKLRLDKIICQINQKIFYASKYETSINILYPKSCDDLMSAILILKTDDIFNGLLVIGRSELGYDVSRHIKNLDNTLSSMQKAIHSNKLYCSQEYYKKNEMIKQIRWSHGDKQ